MARLVIWDAIASIIYIRHCNVCDYYITESNIHIGIFSEVVNGRIPMRRVGFSLIDEL